MQQTIRPAPVSGSAVLGILLIVLGGAALLARATGFEVFSAVGTWGWPLFIIIPGLVLLALSLIPERPAGIGFAIPGAIVTTVGLVLAYQSATGDWESWSYAWALLPGAAGMALIAYGLYAGRAPMVRGGLWLAGIMALLFFLGAWFFQGLFAGRPFAHDIEWWAIGLIVLGAFVAVGAFVRPTPAPSATPPPPATPAPPVSPAPSATQPPSPPAASPNEEERS